MHHPPHVFVFAGVIAMIAFATVTLYALSVEFNRQAVAKTTVVRMGTIKW